jgi:Dicarboxylate transport
MKYFFTFLLVVLVIAAVFWQRLPYENIVANLIKQKLESKGVVVSALTIDSVSGSEAVMSKIELALPAPLNIEKLTAKYSLLNLFFGNKKFDADIVGIKLTARAYEIFADKIIINANKADGTLRSKIEIPSINISGAPAEIPTLTTLIDFSAQDKNILAKINIFDKTRTISADTELSFDVADIEKRNLLIKEILFPWGGGILSVEPGNISLNTKKPIVATLNLKDIDIAALLGKVSEGKINGTGKINGKLPITYNIDGNITLQNGLAESVEAGVISVSPAMLPGENEQLKLARTTLENFHYTKLEILVSSESGKSKISLALEGKNPNAPDARPVNFNINLDGDILPFIQQGILPFTDVKKLFRINKDKEKNESSN